MRQMVTDKGKPVTAFRSDSEIQRLVSMGWKLVK